MRKDKNVQQHSEKKKREMLRITVFDVGHGDNAVIEFPGEDIGIVDVCYRNGQNVPPAIGYLHQLRQTRNTPGPLPIRFLCISHPHTDHIKGIADLVGHPDFFIQQIWLPESLRFFPILNHLNRLGVFENAPVLADAARAEKQHLADLLGYLAEAGRTGTPLIVGLKEGSHVDTVADVRIESWSPSDRTLQWYFRQVELDQKRGQDNAIRDHANRISAVLMLKYGKNRVLFTGDTTKANWSEMLGGLQRREAKHKVPVQVLKVPHHGSMRNTHREMWSTFLAPDGVLIVSASGIRTPKNEFYRKARTHEVYCTNTAVCLHHEGGRQRIGRPCCGDITIEIDRRVNGVKIVTSPTACHS